MKEFVELISALSKYTVAQLLVLGVVALIGWQIWLYANRKKNSAPEAVSDGNRVATLYDLERRDRVMEGKIGDVRQDAAKALSARSREVFDRFDDIEGRVSALEERRRR